MRKVLAVAAALLVAGSTAAVAQGGGGGGGRGMNAEQMKAMYFANITLSAEQNTKVDSVLKKYMDLIAAVRADQTLDQQGRRTKMQENRAKQTDELKAILAADQKTVFEKNMADMQARMGGGRPPSR